MAKKKTAAKVAAPAPMISISGWLTQHTDSHGCYDYKQLAESFKLETGLDAPWNGYSAEQANRTVGTLKGLLAPLAVPPDTRVCDGYNVAYACWREFGNGKNGERIGRLMGRGFIWSACIQALREGGK